MTTDTARAIEHLRDALQSLEYAANRAPNQWVAAWLTSTMTDIRQLMHELEGEGE